MLEIAFVMMMRLANFVQASSYIICSALKNYLIILYEIILHKFYIIGPVTFSLPLFWWIFVCKIQSLQ